MKPKLIFEIGSSVFFSCYDDYVSKDKDVLLIMDSFIDGKTMFNCKIGRDDIFLYRDIDKYGFINEAIESKVPMKCGKFLVLSFIEYIGLSIDELKLFDGMFKEIDESHYYEKIIYDSYIENNGFYLTDEQRKKSYDEYLKTRKK